MSVHNASPSVPSDPVPSLLPNLSTLEIGVKTITTEKDPSTQGVLKTIKKIVSSLTRLSAAQVAKWEQLKEDILGRVRNTTDDEIRNVVRDVFRPEYPDTELSDETMRTYVEAVRAGLGTVQAMEMERQSSTSGVRKWPLGISTEDLAMLSARYFQLLETNSSPYTVRELMATDTTASPILVQIALSGVDAMEKYTNTSQHVHVKIVIRPIMEESTRPPPLATEIHMDDAFIFDNLTRYARRPGVDNPSDLLITSFCTKRPNDGGQHQIYSCGTKIYDGIPVLKHDDMVRLANDTLPTAILTPLQSEEIYTRIFTAKTHDALDGMTNEDFEQAGITIKEAPNLTWTNANAMTFHRSPTSFEVQSGDTSSKGGIRVFAAVSMSDDQDTPTPFWQSADGRKSASVVIFKP